VARGEDRDAERIDHLYQDLGSANVSWLPSLRSLYFGYVESRKVPVLNRESDGPKIEKAYA